MGNILKNYIIGAVFVYPLMAIWAFSDMWQNSTNLYSAVMKIYGLLIIPVLSSYFYTRSNHFLATAFLIVFVFMIIYILLFPALIF